jgi:hypothetical protein
MEKPAFSVEWTQALAELLEAWGQGQLTDKEFQGAMAKILAQAPKKCLGEPSDGVLSITMPRRLWEKN